MTDANGTAGGRHVELRLDGFEPIQALLIEEDDGMTRLLITKDPNDPPIFAAGAVAAFPSAVVAS